MSDLTLYFYDFETWGTNPKKDHPSQFAGIRTDADLNPIGKPLNIYCQIPNDYLPHPEACLITGITPQQSLRDGLIEAEFTRKIYQEFSTPGTCALGYNSIRFDDEVTRNTFFRNFYDPYAREWQHGNSRWDIIDLVRACYALRPEGVNWVYKSDGTPSFKLEELTIANDISHENAHDAMSDVYGTIALAKRVKEAQPRLFDYIFSLRQKQAVGKLIDCYNMKPFIHVSSKLPASQGCCTWMVPIAYHPTNKNAVICINLQQDPTRLAALSTEEIKALLYAKNEDFPDGTERLPLKLIHLNKCPVVLPPKSLSEEGAERLGINRQQCLVHLEWIKQSEGLHKKLQDVYDTPYSDNEQVDVDHSLYSGGFFSDSDKAKMEQIRQMAPEALIELAWQFDDPRIQSMLFRYRARNYPTTLSEKEIEKWQRHRQYRLMEAHGDASIILPEYLERIGLLAEQYVDDARKRQILKDLYTYAQQL
ncbi:exodeoxyribonuclease I [Aestuariibacter sp. AA17]|uniref:Exodeoxyribonuclease I n=1 Tax=Fluctibacter corallii TaxID=2984329 RepID=A0ABT3A9J5_9ALTE|nr:exodeoxyribonuclease I [Aestuariibacter sp. AA17]MCV2885359.1 exodeoxyribonuclease I [Aestuariibacter sp. AA17]